MNIKHYAIPAVALFAAAVFAYGIYVFGIGLSGKEKHAEEVLLSAIEKPDLYENYTYEYADDMDGYEVKTRMVRTLDFGLIRIHSPVFEKAFYFNSSISVLCIKFQENISCSEVVQDSGLTSSAQGMKKLFPSETASKNLKAMKIYIKSNAVKFEKEIGKNEIDGKKCSVIRYTLDYTKLTLADLNEIGMSPSDPTVLYSRNHAFEYCIDNESNVLFAKLDYVFLGENKTSKTKILENGWGIANKTEFSFQKPVNESETRELFINAISAEKTVLACSKNKQTNDNCIKNYAILNSAPDLCILAGTLKDMCILSTASKKPRADLCEKVDDPHLKDGCWIEIVVAKNDSSFCNNIIEQGKKEECLTYTAPIK